MAHLMPGSTIPSLRVQFLQKCSTHAEVAEVLPTEKIRELIGATVERCAGLLDQSHIVWQLWLQWEQSLDR
jgi:hypothetical protein